MPATAMDSSRTGSLLRAADGDRDLAAELIDVFLEEQPRRRDELRRGVTAGDGDLVRRVAQAAQEPLRFFSAHAAAALAAELEGAGARADMTAAADTLARFETAADVLQARLTAIRARIQSEAKADGGGGSSPA